MKDVQLVRFNETTNVSYLNFPVNNGFVTGEELLLQKIVKRILNEKGSNGFEPSVGSTFYKLLGSADSYEESVLEAHVNIALKELVQDIKEEQSLLEDDDAVLTDDEKLYDIYVYEIDYNLATTKWTIYLNVITESNKSIKLQIPITV